MKCRECDNKSKYPICLNCADYEESRLIHNLEMFNENLHRNRIAIFKRTFRLPKVTPLFWISIGFIIIHGFLFGIISQIQNVALQMFTYAPILIYPVTIIYFWGKIPEENIENGLSLIDMKQENIGMRRKKRKILKMLRKPHRTWNKNDILSISFKSYE